jgi:hypothetical protein
MKMSARSLTSSGFDRLRPLVALPVVALVVACDSTVGPGGHDRGFGFPPVAVELVDRATGERLAWTQGTGSNIRWDGGLPAFKVGEKVALNVRFLDDQGREIPLGGSIPIEVRARLDAAAPAGVVAITNRVSFVDIEAMSPGNTRLVFMVWFSRHEPGESVWDTPGIEVPVTVP